MLNKDYDETGTKSIKKSYLEYAMDIVKGRYTVENVPPVLAKHNNWALWKYQAKPGSDKIGKPPFQINGQYAKSNDPKTWNSLSAVIERYEKGGYDGISFMVSQETGLVGIDLDHCINRETGKTTEAWAADIIEKLASYTEYSPTDGIRIWCEGTLPGPSGNDGFGDGVAKLEMYSDRKALTFTGDVLEGYSEIRNRNKELHAVYEFMRSRKKIESEPPPSGGYSDEQPFMWDSRIESLPLKESTKALILNGVARGERSEAIMTVLNGLVFSGLSDAQINAVFEAYAIGEKYREVGNGREKWLQPQIQRARLRITDRASSKKYQKTYREEYKEQASGDENKSSDNAWGKPEPLLNLIPDAPQLPVDCLPKVIRDFCEDTADRMQVQVESVLAVVLVTFAGCIGKNALISPREKDNWKERICLWSCLILPPGMKKSPILDAAILPLKKLQARYAEEYVKEIEDWNIAFSAGKQRQKAWEKSCAKALSKNLSAVLGEDPMLLLPPKPLPKRTYTSDATSEKLVELMSRSPGLTGVFDELAGFLLNMNRYSSGSDRQFYLSCKSGGGHSVDRIGRGEIYADDLYLNIVGGIQPKVARQLFSPKDGAGDDGFFERFGLTFYPNPMTAYNHVDRYPNKNALQNYYSACEKLADCNWAEHLTADEYLPGKGIARFDAEAQAAFDQWDVKHGRDMLLRQDDESINTLLSKAPGLLVQLAFLFHLADWADNACVDVSKVKSSAFDGARVFLEDYLIPMWKRILFAFADDGGESAAQKIGKWLTSEGVKSFTIRDIKRKHWMNLRNNDEIEVPIAVLIEKNWIMEAVKKSNGGRSTVKYTVNPAIYDVAA